MSFLCKRRAGSETLVADWNRYWRSHIRLHQFDGMLTLLTSGQVSFSYPPGYDWLNLKAPTNHPIHDDDNGEGYITQLSFDS